MKRTVLSPEQLTVFERGEDDAAKGPVFPENRTLFLAGILSAWTLGDAKPTPEQREQFNDIARDALSQADEVRRSQ